MNIVIKNTGDKVPLISVGMCEYKVQKDEEVVEIKNGLWDGGPKWLKSYDRKNKVFKDSPFTEDEQ